ncbi:DsrE family protein [Haloferax sp. DFSO52]|uniref:DsrE family protein n=1 Tax=Haloferax sp. DFSO52 TaxID=3388505 RepID=UPI003A8A0C41
MNVVFHVSSGAVGEVRHATNNVNNFLGGGTTDPASVTLLANGDSVYFFTADSPLADNVESLVEAGVHCRVCRNSITARDIDADELVDGIELVPSGVREVVKRQAAGDAYVKVP